MADSGQVPTQRWRQMGAAAPYWTDSEQLYRAPFFPGFSDGFQERKQSIREN